MVAGALLLTLLSQWSFGGGSLGASRETVNTAIVDLYQRGAGLEEPLLKTRVRGEGVVWFAHTGFDKSAAGFN